MDSKESRTIAVPALTLEWWRQLAHDNPQDLPPRIEQYLQRNSDIKSALLEARGNLELLAFAYVNSLPEGEERDQAMQVYHQIRLVFSNGKGGFDHFGKRIPGHPAFASAVEPATNMVGATASPAAGSAPWWVGVDLAAADFSDALIWLKEGKRVQRAGWNGKGQFVRLIDGENLVFSEGGDPSLQAGCHHLMLKNAQGKVVFWVPSAGDLMATDWKVVSDDAADAMPPHLSRMLEELEQLSERLKKLNTFIDGEQFKTLPESEQDLLKCQAKHMADYQDVLVTRVAAAS